MEYMQYMSTRELYERKEELKSYIREKYTFLYDNSIVQYDAEIVEDFEEQLYEIELELGRR